MKPYSLTNFWKRVTGKKTNENIIQGTIPSIDASHKVDHAHSNRTIMVGPRDSTFAGIHNAARHVQNLFPVRYVYLDQVLQVPADYKDSNIIFEGWIPPYDDVINVTGKRHFVRYQSPLTQMELSGLELEHLLFLRSAVNSKKLAGLFVSSEKLFRALHPLAEWWPNAVDLSLHEPPKKDVIPDSIGLYMTYTPRKNLATNLFAARLMGGIVHCSDGLPDTYKQLAQAFDINIHYNARPTDEEYLQRLANLALSLQVTLSESLNYGIVDNLICGTPVITGPNTPLANLHPEFDKWCLVNAVDDPVAIADKGRILIHDPAAAIAACEAGRNMLRLYAEQTSEITHTLLERWDFA